ncbi:hypothetical protein RZN05_10160 [Sphingomonas sp. HF-S4]|uniref:Lipoprotein n=1 Tax=Sphingomonas agrestis TaxID=3080540 RepID=A0ABU3Y7H9_9SPHN|nr:hypothetical protein [Sphingomonas sp. HF-S4]MDV3457345.1 hypothetical protein [Sphingomonas sp. HF-S4]
MRIALSIAICAAVTGCVHNDGRGKFRLSEDEMLAAWVSVAGRAQAQAQQEGVEPLWNPPPRFGSAVCTWIEFGRKAHCSYLKWPRYSSRGPGIPEEADLYKTEDGWDFGY